MIKILKTIVTKLGGVDTSEKNHVDTYTENRIVNVPGEQIASIENGTAVIVDGRWCYWIDSNDKIYCVNGASKSIYNINNSECQDAPIEEMFSDIEKIAQ